MGDKMTKREAVLGCITELIQLKEGEYSPIVQKWYERWKSQFMNVNNETLPTMMKLYEFHLVVSTKINSIYQGFPDNW